MRGLSIVLVVAVGLAAGCGGGSNESSKPSAPTKKSGSVNTIYPQAVAPQRVTCGQFDSNSPKAAAFVEDVGKASGETTDHSYLAVRDICRKSKTNARPYRLSVKKLRAGDYR
jgi:hypothetical protein